MSKPEPTRRWYRRHRKVAVGLTALVSVSVVAVGLVGAYAWSVNHALSSHLHHQANMLPAHDRPGQRAAGQPGAGTSRQSHSGSTGSDNADDGGSASGHAGTSPAGPGPVPGKALDFVLIGSDSRAAGDARQGRSDALMVLHLDAVRQHAYLISFPRDMWVPIPGHGEAKINAAYAWGGPALTVRTLEQMLGVQMDHVAVIDFTGFIELTKLLGGVTIDNDYAFSTNGYTYPKGEITLSGDRALWFVRDRHQLPRGDFDRDANQRKVVKAIIDKGLSRSTLAHPERFTDFVAAFADTMSVDSTFTAGVARSLAFSVRDLRSDDIVTLQAPVAGTGTADGQSIDVVDWTGVSALGRALRNGSLPDYLRHHPAESG